MTFDEKLAQALKESFEERVQQSMSDENEHRFSLAYRIWEHMTLKKLRKKRPVSVMPLRKVRRIVTVSLFAAAVTFILTAGAIAGITIGRFSFNDKREYSELFLSGLSSDKIRIEEYYGLPEEDGWTIDNYSNGNYIRKTLYTRGDKIVIFSQNVIRGNMGHVNTENAVVEPMSLYEENDGFFIAFQNRDCGLYWVYDGYLFSLSGNLDKNELLDLAYSTNIINL